MKTLDTAIESIKQQIVNIEKLDNKILSKSEFQKVYDNWSRVTYPIQDAQFEKLANEIKTRLSKGLEFYTINKNSKHKINIGDTFEKLKSFLRQKHKLTGLGKDEADQRQESQEPKEKAPKKAKSQPKEKPQPKEIVKTKPKNKVKETTVLNSKTVDMEDCFAKFIPINSIKVDPSRFQNRTDAYSEISANAVAENYDPAKFDPITIWLDPKDNEIYVLSGHSRLEGMKRRKEKHIPAKFFEGSEKDAIQFARVDANRLTTAESLVEDINAYRLMKEGDSKRKIEPKSQKEINVTFKGKQPKTLDALSELNPKGQFIEFLSNPELAAEVKGLKRIAVVVGNFKKDTKTNGKEVSNEQENSIFKFILNSPKARQINDADLKDLLSERFDAGKEYLFQCGDDDCPDELMSLDRFTNSTEKAKMIKELKILERERDSILARFKSKDDYFKIYTEQEKEVYRRFNDEIEQKIKSLRKKLDMPEKQQAFFGVKKKQNSNGKS